MSFGNVSSVCECHNYIGHFFHSNGVYGGKKSFAKPSIVSGCSLCEWFVEGFVCLTNVAMHFVLAPM